MKAFVVERYGKDGLRAADLPEPEVGDVDVLVKVSAASVNPLDKMVRNHAQPGQKVLVHRRLRWPGVNRHPARQAPRRHGGDDRER